MNYYSFSLEVCEYIFNKEDYSFVVGMMFKILKSSKSIDKSFIIGSLAVRRSRHALLYLMRMEMVH